ncbi:Protein CBG27866 [Caenorhabditis briggsae]|uniref:Protein CBG27866 n=1 Tax=Caenorhabditis briggsae TaxID=6238 RepID=B6IEG1_CAEBR|nr:Protein CBG27866 [Caenorhabditis briggsae]CAR98291.1 Protein CBG27866 [Caenorhabditis briggsae]
MNFQCFYFCCFRIKKTTDTF